VPGRLRLPHYRRSELDGVTTVDDAVEACRQSGLRGWDLVAFAQHLVYRKFTFYSTCNLWDTPARAFEHGMGYCTQYNLALKSILDRLGFRIQAVFSLKVQVADDTDWTMGHTWLRVALDGEVRDVCAGRADNRPGANHFVPLAPVWPGSPAILFLSHLGAILLCGTLEWKALLSDLSGKSARRFLLTDFADHTDDLRFLAPDPWYPYSSVSSPDTSPVSRAGRQGLQWTLRRR
jgi:hypothetical protein